MVPEIWCAADGRTDQQMDGKSDIERWVRPLKIANTNFKKNVSEF